jgi:hypothetical protein
MRQVQLNARFPNFYFNIIFTDEKFSRSLSHDLDIFYVIWPEPFTKLNSLLCELIKNFVNTSSSF